MNIIFLKHQAQGWHPLGNGDGTGRKWNDPAPVDYVTPAFTNEDGSMVANPNYLPPATAAQIAETTAKNFKASHPDNYVWVPQRDALTVGKADERSNLVEASAGQWADPESIKDSFLGKVVGFIPQAAVMAGLAYAGGIAMGGWSSAGAATEAAGAGAFGNAAGMTAADIASVGGATASSAASGVAGALGMDAGIGATALNAGALNTGISLAQGNDLGTALTSGVRGAALSAIGGWSSDQIAGALPADSISPGLNKVISTTGGSAIAGGAGAAMSGGNIADGILNGAKTGLINTAGNYVGKQVSDYTGSSTLGGAASGGTTALLSGRDIGTGLLTGAIDGATGIGGSGALINTVLNRNSDANTTNVTTPLATPVTSTTGATRSTPNMNLFGGFDISGWSSAILNPQKG